MVKIKRNKHGQEEMVGFALIVIIVAIILLVFLAFSLREDDSQDIGESYEVESFLQAALQHTTSCESSREAVDIRDLVFSCNNQATCSDGRDSCEVLEETLMDLASAGWPVGAERPVKGYELRILANEGEILMLREGNVTREVKAGKQDFSQGSSSIEIRFTAYY